MIVLCAVLGMLGMQALLPTNMTETFQTMPLLAHAEEEDIPNSGSCGENVTWQYDAETETLTIEGTGTMNNYDLKTPPWGNRRISHVVLKEGITNVGGGLLHLCDCEGVTEIKISKGVTEIGAYAFEGWENLQSVEIPDTVTRIRVRAFSQCKSLTSITLPDSITKMDEGIFSQCSSLESVHLPKNLTVLPLSTFNGCTSLTSIEIPETVTEVGSRAFYGCTNLASIEIPDAVTTIGNYAFYDCQNLSSVKLSSNITVIQDSVFQNCQKLTSITLPESLKTIGVQAFSDTSLESIVIPKGVTSIGKNAFCLCGNLEDITISDTVKNFGAGAFSLTPWFEEKINESDFLIINDALLYAKNCTGDIKIPDTVKSIEESAFVNTGITSVDIPESVTSIKESAFSVDTLVSATIHNPNCKIGKYAFRYFTTIYSYPHSYAENYAEKNNNNFIALEGESPLQYTYEIIPLLPPFNQYFFIKTNNPDPQSFRFKDNESIYRKEALVTPTATVFDDIVYEDTETLRTNGGYIFYSGMIDGGEISLQVKNLDDSWEEIGYTFTLPELYNDVDYLIHTYGTNSDFFADMDAIQEGLFEHSVYSVSFIRGNLQKVGNFWYVSTSKHIDHSFYIRSPYDYKDNEQLFASAIYPYCCDSLGFPNLMASVAKRMERSSSYVWNAESHAKIDVTFNGETHTYGGQGSGEGQGLTKDQILHYFTLESPLTLESVHELLDKYSALEVQDDIPRKDALTFQNIRRTVGDGSWVLVSDGYQLGTDYAYFYQKDDLDSYVSGEFGVGNEIYWRGSIGYASDSWVDGRYVDKYEKFAPNAKFEEHPQSSIILQLDDFPVVAQDGTIHEVHQTVKYLYNEMEQIWKPETDAISDEDYQNILTMTKNGTIDEKYLDTLQLTPEEVQELHVDRNTAKNPESGYIYDGTVNPSTRFDENGILFENGDITENGILEVSDMLRMKDYLYQQEKLTQAEYTLADMNQDGIVNVIDLALLKQKLQKEIPTLKKAPDVLALQQYLHQNQTLDSEQMKAFDINQDGIVNVIDLALLKKKYLDGIV